MVRLRNMIKAGKLRIRRTGGTTTFEVRLHARK